MSNNRATDDLASESSYAETFKRVISNLAECIRSERSALNGCRSLHEYREQNIGAQASCRIENQWVVLVPPTTLDESFRSGVIAGLVEELARDVDGRRFELAYRQEGAYTCGCILLAFVVSE